MKSKAALLLPLLAGVAFVAMPGAAHAQSQRVVSNIASISWQTPAGPQTVQSNRVDIAVTLPPSPQPFTAGIYRIGANGRPTTLSGSGCPTQGGQNLGSNATGGRSANMDRETRFSVGESVGFGVSSAADNRDPTVRETLSVRIRTATGDEELLHLREDAPDSGFFVGYLPTVRMPPAPVSMDCRLSVDAGRDITISLLRDGETAILSQANVSFLVDPFGIVFDSGDGTPVAGATVTIVDAVTGAPAQVFGDDGVSAYPSSIVTGSTVTDASGAVYSFPPGDYRFPFVAPGRYRLVVAPPAPYRAPSAATPAELAGFVRPDNGQPFTITDGSYGRVFELFTPEPVRIDIPVDRSGDALVLTKTAHVPVATPGDVVRYRIDVRNADPRRTTGAVTVTDSLPAAMRFRRDTVRLNDQLVTPDFTADGRTMTLTVPPLAVGGTAQITYLAEIRPDSRPGDAVNIADARDNRGAIANRADALVRIERDIIGERIHIIGRVTSGGCGVDPDAAPGVGGVRVMLQDGSFSITDSDGRYHFEGVRPGLSVVQIDPSTLPRDSRPVTCAPNGRSAGSAISRFVEGRGGELRRADFRVEIQPSPPSSPDASPPSPPNAPPGATLPPRPTPLDSAAAAGGGRDWFAGLAPGIRWLWPEPDHNPRSPAVRVAIAHAPGQRVQLLLGNREVDPVNLDGVTTSPDGRSAVTVWRGVEIADGPNVLTARVLNQDGSVAETLTRTVHFATPPMAASLVRDRSLLVADGVSRPVIAVRLLDRAGRPIRQGMVGDFTVLPPHRAAIELDSEQVRQLSGLERAAPVWRIPGDDGIAYIELEPTTTSGTARIDFLFRDGEITRRQTLDVWLNPGNRPWTVVGFAAGTIGYNTLNDRMEPVAETLDSDNVDGRVALYAQGRIRGDWLMTLAYDSDREADEVRFGGVIDPRAYYTVYADRADRGFDAASVRNLYLRLERPQFVALFGDFETGFNDTELGRYQRAMNGLRAEYRSDNLAATAFVADTPYRHRRDELQGNGLTGPYQLSARGILANSERIVIETRDRLRSNVIVDRRVLSRHIDYDIDYFAGTLRFRQPILSRDSALNPQFIVADYEVDGVGQRVTNAGGRVAWTSDDERLRIGGTLLHDETDSTRINMGAVDLRFRPSPATEIRAEFAHSDAALRAGVAGNGAGSAQAWLIEAEHHTATVDLLAYAREQQSGFGVGQLNAGGNGSRKIGFDGRVRLSSDLSVLGSLWQETRLDSGANRYAGRILGEYRIEDTGIRAGLTFADDELPDGSRNRSTLLQLGATQRLFAGALEIDGQTEFALGGDDESVDFPTRHRLGARYAFDADTALTAAYEVASGGNVDARTLRVGIDLKPWAGGRLAATANQQDFVELGARSFAAYGLTQAFQLSENWSIDFTIDGQRTLAGIDAGDVLEPEQPVASGGFIGNEGLLTEDFLAVTAGATWRSDLWSMTGRAEYRDGEVTDRAGITIGLIRQIGEGRALGGLFSWTNARAPGDLETRAWSAELSWAHRPADSRWSWLNKLEARHDAITGAVLGQPGPIGGPALLLNGDARSTRLINSLTINYSPMSRDNDSGLWEETGEYAWFWGVRYASDRIGLDDVEGWSTTLGADWRYDLSQTVGVGVSANVRIGTNGRAISYGGGPQIVVTPLDNANLVIGYNLAGYRDRDFEEARYSRSGLYATLRMKFDQTTIAGLFGN